MATAPEEQEIFEKLSPREKLDFVLKKLKQILEEIQFSNSTNDASKNLDDLCLRIKGANSLLEECMKKRSEELQGTNKI